MNVKFLSLFHRLQLSAFFILFAVMTISGTGVAGDDKHESPSSDPKPNSTLVANHPLAQDQGWNADGYRPLKGMVPTLYWDSNDLTRLHKLGINTHNPCVQLVQKKGDPEDMARVLFSEKDCPTDPKQVMPQSDITFQLNTLVFTGALFKSSPLANFLAKAGGVSENRFGWFFDPEHPTQPVGFWNEDKGSKENAAISMTFCTRSFAAAINPAFDFSKVCVPKVHNGQVAGLEFIRSASENQFWQKLDTDVKTATAEAEEQLRKNREARAEEPLRAPRKRVSANDSYEGMIERNQEQTSKSQYVRPRGALEALEDKAHRQVRDTSDAASELLSTRGGVLSRMADVKKIEQSSRILQGDMYGSLKSGRDSALLRGNYGEALHYQQMKATSDLLNGAFGNRSSTQSSSRSRR